LTVGSPLKIARIGVPAGSVVTRWIELCFVLLISFGVYVFNSVYFYRHGHSRFHFRPDEYWSLGILQEAISLVLLALVLSRRSIRLSDLGLRWSIRDLFSGLAIALFSYGAYWVSYHLLLLIHNSFLPSAPFTPEPAISYGRPPLLSILFALLNPFCEELIARAYLMREVFTLTGSWAFAAGLSTLLQASYHIYYGWPVTISVAIQFLVFSVYYARKQRTTPLIVAHGVFDVYWVLMGLI
jgi:membrane protease YdiL (CAAX protease family)